jgi:hypothetical protein
LQARGQMSPGVTHDAFAALVYILCMNVLGVLQGTDTVGGLFDTVVGLFLWLKTYPYVSAHACTLVLLWGFVCVTWGLDESIRFW